MVGGPTQMDVPRPKRTIWSSLVAPMLKSGSEYCGLTAVTVWTILDHFMLRTPHTLCETKLHMKQHLVATGSDVSE